MKFKPVFYLNYSSPDLFEIGEESDDSFHNDPPNIIELDSPIKRVGTSLPAQSGPSW